MARRYITAQFNPYSYEQLAAPVEKATAVLAQEAKGLTALMMQNDLLGRYLDPVEDKEEYEIYKQNEQTLRDGVDSLMKYGLNSSNYQIFQQAAKTYASDIKPMQDAVARRMQYNSSLAELLTSNPDAVLKGPIHRPLKDFYNGAPPAEIIKGTSIQKDVETTMAAIAQTVGSIQKSDIPSFNKYKDIIETTTGFSYEKYLQMRDDPQSLMYQVIHDVMQKHGAEDMNGQSALSNMDDYKKLFNYALQGTYGALGKTDYSLVDNGRAHQESMALQWHKENQARLDEARKLAMQMQIDGDPRPVNEIAQAILNGTIDFRNPKNGNYTVDTMPTSNNISTLPSTDTKGLKVSYNGSTSFNYDEIIGSANYATANDAQYNKETGLYSWDNLDNPHPFAKGSDKKYITTVLQEVLGKNYKSKLNSLTRTEVDAIHQVLDDNAKKVQVSNYKFYKGLTNEVGHNMLEVMSNEFVDEKGNHPTEEALKGTVGYTVVYETAKPDELAILTNGHIWKASASTVFDLYSQSGFETSNAYDQFTIYKNDMQTGRNNTDFWNLSYDDYSHKLDNFFKSAKKLLDSTLEYFGENVAESKNLVKH